MNTEENPFRAPKVAAPQPMEPRNLGASAEVVEVLKSTRPWVLFLAVVLFVFVGLIVIGGFGVIAFVGLREGSGRFGLTLGLVYLFLAILYAVPGFFLLKYASRIKRLTQTPSEETLVDAIKAQTRFWRIVGIILLTMLALWFGGFVLLLTARSF